MEIRPVDRCELDALLALYQHLHEVDDPPPAGAELEHIWNELQGSPRHRLLGAYLDDYLVASCTVTVVPNLTRGGRPYAIIENVVTRSDQRRRGLGKALMAAALEFAWSQRCYKVMLLTGRKDEATLRFYEEAGFDRHGKQAFIARAPSE